MIGFKIYYEKDTGDVILTIPEQNAVGAMETTKEQDFIMFYVLQARNPSAVDFIQLPYGQYRSDFKIANSWKVDLKTGQVLFEYPKFETPISEQIHLLRQENEELKVENKDLKLALAESVEAQQPDKLENQLAVAELVEILTNKGVL
ncbi:hypothetical protein ACZ11_24040 [Lysinibacillus xylanilyticus]|uniref:Bacteriophage SP-beta YorD domain-containing protein n=1 Tax=Lysinibacillus xylanilyticus TaxID=582475 RepID=A0A0K9F292_9BACI|nr:hypothetical protein [Lysinibacillus xylanilyticus]KMY28301.1 hypothetical protein ACZ11_24040 [Lysinibacillus xylanilyticus]